jgi:hypothetical protein
MIKLSDIADAKQTVALVSGEVEVRGLPMETIVKLIAEFPGLAKMFSGESDLAASIMAIPGAVYSVIRAGVVDPVDAELVHMLPVTDLLDLLIPIVELTFPGGVGPFLVKIERLAKVLAK